MNAVNPGSTVRVANIISAAQTVYLFASVLTVAPSLPGLLGEDGQPTLSIAFLDPTAAPSVLGSANWHAGFQRQTGVAHATHADVIAGRRGIYWIDVLPDASTGLKGSGLPELTTGQSAVYSRERSDAFFEKAARTVPVKVEPVPTSAAPASTSDSSSMPTGSSNSGSASPGSSPVSSNPAQITPQAIQAQAERDAATGNGLQIETKTYSDGSTATGVAALPDQSSAQQEASENNLSTDPTLEPAAGTEAAPVTTTGPESAQTHTGEPAPVNESATDSTVVQSEHPINANLI